MKYFTGIDVSLRSVSICVVDDAGTVLVRSEGGGRDRHDRGHAASLQR